MKLYNLLFAAILSFLSFSVSAQMKAGKKAPLNYVKFHTCSNDISTVKNNQDHCASTGLKLERSKKEQMKRAVNHNESCPLHLEISNANSNKRHRDLTLSPKEKMKREVVRYDQNL